MENPIETFEQNQMLMGTEKLRRWDLPSHHHTGGSQASKDGDDENVTWNGNVPSLKFSYEINVGHGPTNYAGIEQMMFDPADNLLIFSRQFGFMAFTMKNPARKSLTLAPSSQVLEIKTTGIENIEINENGSVVYYNLQGVKVANPENGVFIRVQGGKASKVAM